MTTVTLPQILAVAINTVGTLLVVWALARLIPWLRERAPWLLPILAAVAGPAVAVAQSWLAAQLGQPIDLSPILAVLSGLSAVAVHQIGRQVRRVQATGGTLIARKALR